MGSKAKLSGLKTGRLLVGEYLGGSLWVCVCECGVTTSVSTKRLNNGDTQSCGCLQKERASQTMRKHGMSRKPIYQVWRTMKSRCTSINDGNYPNYGGRGISVCESWLNSFENFFADMGERPYGMTLDRKDTNGNYEPGNCRWATSEEQQNNRRNNVLIELDGKTNTLAQWAKETGISISTIRSRLKSGMSSREILSSPSYSKILSSDQVDSVLHLFPNKNRFTGLSKIAKELGVHRDTLRKQLQERLE